MSASLQRARPQIVAPRILRGDFADGLEIAGRGDREAGLDDIDAQIDQGLSDLHFLGEVHARAGRLLAVAERGVEDADGACGGHGDLLVSVEDVSMGTDGTEWIAQGHNPWAQATPTKPWWDGAVLSAA